MTDPGSAALQALYERDRTRAERLLPPDDRLTVFEAAAFGRVEHLRKLLADDSTLVDAVSPDGFTALHLAVFGGSLDAARLLLEQGADVERPSEHPTIRGVRPLGTAVFVRNVELARLLLDHGADPNAEQEGGFRAIDSASANGDQSLVDLLVERGANPS